MCQSIWIITIFLNCFFTICSGVLIRFESARQSGTFSQRAGAEKAVDGLNNTCSVACTGCPGYENVPNKTFAWLQADMSSTYQVVNVGILVNQDDTNARYLENFLIVVKSDNSTSAPLTGQVCYHFSGTVKMGQTLLINCAKDLAPGRYLTLIRAGGYRADAISVCEVWAWGFEATQQVSSSSVPPFLTSTAESSVTTIGSTPTFRNESAVDKPDATMLIIGISLGAIFGFLIVAIIIVLVLYFYCFRKSAVAEDLEELKKNTFYSLDVPISNQHYIKEDEIYDHVTRMGATGFRSEYMSLPEDALYSVTEGLAQLNRSKNRFQNVLPYDNNRIIIRSSNLGYINASLVKGAKKKYIVTQDPLENATEDFWIMVYEYKINIIVSLSSLCQFWPIVTKSYSHMTVTLATEDKFSSYSKRCLHLVDKNKTMHVTQFQYTEEDILSKPSTFLHFLQMIRRVENDVNFNSGQVLVHCKTGIGISGCFLALDILFDRLKSSGSIDVPTCVESLRYQRMNSVQTLEQYEFIYKVLLEETLTGHFVIQCPIMTKNFSEILEDKTNKLEKMLQVVANKCGSETSRTFMGPIDGYKSPGTLCLTRLSEAEEFLKLIYDFQADYCIVASDSKMKKIWPTAHNLSQFYGFIEVTCIEEESQASDVITTSQYKIVNLADANKETRHLAVLNFHFPPLSTPEVFFSTEVSPSHVVDLYNAISGGNYVSESKIIFSCSCYSQQNLSLSVSDNLQHSGMMATAFYLLDVLKIEQVCDVMRACRHVMPCLLGTSISLRHFKFLHQVVIEFLQRRRIFSLESSKVKRERNIKSYFLNLEVAGSSFA